jgi:hypothetical protein
VPLDKGEGVVKDELVLSGAQAPLVGASVERTEISKTLELSR